MKTIEKELDIAVKNKFRYWNNFSAYLGFRGNFAKQSIMRKLNKINSVLNKLDIELTIKQK